MQAIRHLLAQRHLAGLVCAAALLLKLFVPAGYMLAADRGGIAVTLCTGVAPAPASTSAMHGAMAAAGHPNGHGEPTDHGKADMPCAFAGLSAAALGAVAMTALAVPVVFAPNASPVAAVVPPWARAAHLRPPPRGPPARP